MHKCANEARCERCGNPVCDVCAYQQDWGDKTITICSNCYSKDVKKMSRTEISKLIKICFFATFFIANAAIMTYVVIKLGVQLSGWANMLLVFAIIFGPIDAIAIFLFKKVAYGDDPERYSDSWINVIISFILAPIYCFVFMVYSIQAIIGCAKTIKALNKDKADIIKSLNGDYDYLLEEHSNNGLDDDDDDDDFPAYCNSSKYNNYKDDD